MTVPSRRFWLAPADFAIACACYVLAAYLAAEVDPSIYLLYEGGLQFIAVTSSIIVAAFYFQGLYVVSQRPQRVYLIQQLSGAMGAAFLFQALVDYVARGLGLRLHIMVYGSLIAIPSLLAWRLFYAAMALRSTVQRVLLIGATSLTREIAGRLASTPGCGLAVVGYLDDNLPPGTALAGGQVLGPVRTLSETWQALQPDRVVMDFAGEEQLPAPLVKTSIACRIKVERAAGLYETLFRRVAIAHLPPSAALFSSEMSPAPAQVAIQSIYNNLVGLAALVVLAPLMFLIAILIKLTSPGPVREGPKTVGLNEVPFRHYRFRCHRIDQPADGESPAYTPLGRWLERLRLAGLPLLLNVLRGEMALIGPRPVRCDRAAALCDELPLYRLRFAVRPGLTGWSRLNIGPRPADPAVELEYDLYYVKHLSVALDIYVVLHTLEWVFRVISPKAAKPDTGKFPGQHS